METANPLTPVPQLASAWLRDGTCRQVCVLRWNEENEQITVGFMAWRNGTALGFEDKDEIPLEAWREWQQGAKAVSIESADEEGV